MTYLRRCITFSLLALTLGVAAQTATPVEELPPPPTAEELLTPPPEATRHPSGLVSQVLKVGSGEEHPDANDYVLVHFVGRSASGEIIQSTRNQGQPRVLNLGKVFPGWQEGMALMVAGEHRRLWIPEALGSQAKGQEGDAVFDVELLAVRRVANLPEAYRRPPQGAERTASGALTLQIGAGTGDASPMAEEYALVSYTGYHSDGRIFDSTLERGRPSLFPMNQVMPAFADCVQRMVVGEKRMCWVPAAVAKGQWMKKPQGDLIFEIELVRILPADSLLPGGRSGG